MCCLRLGHGRDAKLRTLHFQFGKHTKIVDGPAQRNTTNVQVNWFLISYDQVSRAISRLWRSLRSTKIWCSDWICSIFNSKYSYISMFFLQTWLARNTYCWSVKWGSWSVVHTWSTEISFFLQNVSARRRQEAVWKRFLSGIEWKKKSMRFIIVGIFSAHFQTLFKSFHFSWS